MSTEGVDDLDVLDPAGAAITFSGRQVEIKPLRAGQLPAFARAVKPLAGALTEALDAFGPEQFLALLADHGDQLLEAASIGSGIPRAEIDAADTGELMSLVLKVIRVNADFFAHRLLPALRGMRQTAAAPGAGPTPSTP